MKLTRFYILLCSVFVISLNTMFSQEVFRVLAKKGNVSIETGGSSIPAKPSDKVMADSKIVIGDGGYLSLVHSTSRRNVELLKSGTFKAKELSASVSSVKLSTSQRFADFVVNEVGKSSNQSYQDNMKLAGSVSRSSNKQKTAQEQLQDKMKEKLTEEQQKHEYLKHVSIDDWFKGNEDVNLTAFFPYGMVAQPSRATFKWIRGTGNNTKFIVNIWDVDKVVLLYAVETEDTTVTVNLAEAGVTESCFWSVESKNPSFETEKYELAVLTKEQQDTMEMEKAEIIKELGETSSPFAKLVLARFAEEYLLLSEAERLFKEVMDENPTVPEYKGLYCKFLLRNGNSIIAKPYL